MPNTNNSESNNTNNAAANNTNNTVEKSNFDTFLGWLKKCKRNEWEWFNNMIDGPIQGFSKVTGIPIYDFIDKFRADDKKQKKDKEKKQNDQNDQNGQGTGKKSEINIVSNGNNGPMPKPEGDTLSEVTMTPGSKKDKQVSKEELNEKNKKSNTSIGQNNPTKLSTGRGFGKEPVPAVQGNGLGRGNVRG